MGGSELAGVEKRQQRATNVWASTGQLGRSGGMASSGNRPDGVGGGGPSTTAASTGT